MGYVCGYVCLSVFMSTLQQEYVVYMGLASADSMMCLVTVPQIIFPEGIISVRNKMIKF